MKKGALLAAFCLTLSLSGAAMATSGEHTLISVNYLTGSYTIRLMERLEQLAIQRAEEHWAQRISIQPQSLSWQGAEDFEPIYLRQNEWILLSAGSGLLWHSGSATASAPLLDVTAGQEVPAGTPLTSGHRYLAEVEARVVVENEWAACSTEGLYQTNATGEPAPPPVSTPPAPSQPVTPPTATPAPGGSSGFSDVGAADWFYDPVLYVVERGLFQGTGPGTFSPNDDMNRGMLATVLHRMAGGPEGGYRGSFSDVPEGQWYTPGVEWAAAVGIVNGVTALTFAPNQSITREQIAVMMYRYAAAFDFDVTGRGNLREFSDGTLVSDYARNAVAWAVEAGILQGSGGALQPGQNARRCEVATMLMRFDLWMD